jgi:probable HAF family extracellular repeat protein
MKRILLLLLAIVSMVAPSWAQYRYRTVDFTGASRTRVFAINNSRQYVGAYWDSANNAHAIFFDGRKLRPLDPNGVVGTSQRSWAYSLNNEGQIVGRVADTSGVFHGYVFQHGQATLIDYPGASGTEAYGINDRGDIIGVFHDSAGALHAFSLQHRKFKQIDLPNGETTPLSINDHDGVVGEFADVPGTVGHGYLQLRNGKFTLYDIPGAPANSTFFISINNFNEILGEYFPTDGYQNFILADGEVILFNLPVAFAPTFVSAQTINDLGDVVGWFDDANGEHGFLAFRKHR